MSSKASLSLALLATIASLSMSGCGGVAAALDQQVLVDPMRPTILPKPA